MADVTTFGSSNLRAELHRPDRLPSRIGILFDLEEADRHPHGEDIAARREVIEDFGQHLVLEVGMLVVNRGVEIERGAAGGLEQSRVLGRQSRTPAAIGRKLIGGAIALLIARAQERVVNSNAARWML